ncbi:hypothetical protein MHU86_10838 [Fragilaria crotonensis]|nr:hypothetical protein MHU86_10838 [Fragilaria crotonensis]
MLTIEIQRLLFLFVSVLGVATSTPLPANYTPYETNGTILGDFTDVKSFPPKVLLRFLAGCANVTIIDSDRCLVSTFAKLRVPFDLDDTFACDTCSNPPNITDSLIEASALEAQSECAAAGESASLLDMTTLSQQYMTIVASPCWGSLRQDDAYLFVESKWLRTCAGANLPYPIPTEFINMFTIDSVQHRSTLTCMLDKFFDADPIVFGLPSAPKASPESCLVPGYDNITSNCESIIGPKAYARCSSRSGDNQVMSMAFTGNDEAIFVEEFCSILETLNTDVGRECMMDVCDFDPTPSPSRVPSSDPSSIPTTTSPAPFPVSSPSKTPSTKPSPAPVFTFLPTPSPGKVTPTSRPSPSDKAPSSAPSQLPSSESTVLATKPSSVPFPHRHLKLQPRIHLRRKLQHLNKLPRQLRRRKLRPCLVAVKDANH